MSTSFVILFLQFILLFLSFQNYKNDEYIKRISSYVLIFILTLISGLRYNVGDDFMNYEQMYLDPDNVRNSFTEPIWHIFAQMLRYFKCSSTVWFLCTSFIINSCFITGIRKLSKNFYLSVTFYLAMPHLFFESLNIVRQFVAIAIIFRFSNLFFQKKYCKFILAIVLASCFHKSAILTVPFFLLSLIKFPNILLILISFFCFIFRNIFLSVIVKIISSVSMYAGYIDEIISSQSNSGLYAYLLLLLCLFIVFCFRKNNSIEINILKNLSLMSFCIYLLFYTFQAGQRIGFYVLPYFVLLVPYIIPKYKINGNFIIIGGILSLFLLFTLKSGFSQIYTFRF